MSYQNPITLTPTLYQSSDPDAPQLLGQLGDIKSIFKACLVTGYGNKQGAGYTIENETDVSAEFISPNIMMSKIGVEEVNDYCYPFCYDGTQKVRAYWNAGQLNTYEIRRFKTRGWVMLVCELGLYFIVTVNGMSKVNYMGLTKSAINDNNQNMAMLSLGYIGSSSTSLPIGLDFRLGKHTDAKFLSNGASLSWQYNKQETFFITMVSDVYYRSDGSVLSHQPALLIKNAMTSNLERRTVITEYQGRPVLSVFLPNSTSDWAIDAYAFGAMIYLDYWEY